MREVVGSIEDLTALVPIVFEGTAHRACLDTGFNGELAIPRAMASRLGLVHVGDVTIESANAETIPVEVYLGELEWLGEIREVLVVTTASSQILLGMQLLEGTRLEMEVSAGRLSIRALDR